MSFYLKLFSIFAALLFSACATLDKGECQVADWQQIEFSDGSNGRLSDGRMDKHTSACAEHNIIPDEPLYRVGHEAGVLKYCPPEQGLKLGRSGELVFR